MMCCVVGVLYIGIGYIKDRTRIGLFTLNFFLREKIYDVVVVKWTMTNLDTLLHRYTRSHWMQQKSNI